MKRILIGLCITLLVLCSVADAEEQYNYISYGDYGILLGKILNEIGCEDYSRTSEGEAVFDDVVYDFLRLYQEENGLEKTGCFDFETLHHLLNVPYSEYSDVYVWIPMHGGAKHHKKEACSNMIQPQQMPIDCAERLGFTYCKKCNRELAQISEKLSQFF